MNQDESLSPELQRRLDEVIAACLKAAELGVSVDREEMLARHPELAEHLRSFFAAQDQQDADAPTLPHDPSPGDAETLAAPPPSPGTSPGPTNRYFGDYELLEEIARGGMGVVFKARQVSLNRTVALKMILAGQLASKEDVRRFYTEAEAAANLDHSGIVPIFEVGEHEGQHYFSMGYVEGQSLAHRVADGPLPPREAAKLIMQVAEAIAYAHEQGVIHRDLKPGNILLDQDGQPRVTDFGLAKRVEGDSDLTATGQVVGTPSYMPPEQAAGKVDEVGPLADVYSLGAVLYTLLTGRPPFQSASMVDTLRAVLEQEPVSPRQLNPAVPRDLETICLKCLRKEPGKRYGAAKDLAEDLGRWLANKPILARPVGRIEKAWLWCKRRPEVACMLVVLFVAAIVVQQIVWHSRRKNDERRTVAFVKAVLTVSAEAVPYAIDDLRPLRELAIPTLQRRFQDSSLERSQRLRAAFALIALGQASDQYVVEVVNQVAEVSSAEYRNIETALRMDGEAAKQKLVDRADAVAKAGDVKTQCRLAVLLLYLGDETAAVRCCSSPADPETHIVDPTTRTTFIHRVFPSWHGETSRLAEVLKATQSSELRSSLCLSAGLTSEERLANDDREVLTPVLRQLFIMAADGATHSAAGWTLRQWKVELPILEPSRKEDPQRDWWVNTIGMTLLRIPAGTFTMGSNDSPTEKPPHRVSLTKPFWLCDREVTVDQFKLFVQDGAYFKDYPDDRPVGGGIFSGDFYAKYSPTGRHPAIYASWDDAVLFCNWISRKEGLKPCYRLNGKEWMRDPEGRGYFLPTEAQWEYACRAGSETQYCFGDDRSLLVRYSVFDSKRTEPVGSKLPNAWGLFDTHGNLWEWIQDWYDNDYYKRSPFEDPPGPEKGTSRVLRGGSFGNRAGGVRAAYRNGLLPDDRGRSVGFRLART